MGAHTLARISLLAGAAALLARCQSYPFEYRNPKRVEGRAITQKVATVTPTDILFVVDNSGSMFTARTELGNNMGAFIEQMSQSGADFQVGIVTTDVECNVPELDCTTPVSSASCCGVAQAAGGVACRKVTSGGKNSFVDCDGGRLRTLPGKPPVWTPPAPEERASWAADFKDAIMALGCNGSGLESGLEAARRAVNCASFGYDAAHPERCPAPDIAERNAGLVRPEADLVVIFVTDEDDCSFVDPSRYHRPPDPTSAADQAAHLCSPQECYAYFGRGQDQNGDGLQDWADAVSSSYPLFKCSGNPRQVNPPYPDSVDTFVQELVAAKGGDVRRVRAAGILSGTLDAAQPLGFKADACVGSELGVTSGCGCWSASAVSPNVTQPNFYCNLTASLGHLGTASPPPSGANECSAVGAGGGAPSAPQPGCKAMPGGRYTQFLEKLATARGAAGARKDTLADSICQAEYDGTMFSIVNTIILTSCFQLGEAPADAASLGVSLNGRSLPNVAPRSGEPGWSLSPGAREICLEGGVKKNIGDTFEIFVVDATPSP